MWTVRTTGERERGEERGGGRDIERRVGEREGETEVSERGSRERREIEET